MLNIHEDIHKDMVYCCVCGKTILKTSKDKLEAETSKTKELSAKVADWELLIVNIRADPADKKSQAIKAHRRTRRWVCSQDPGTRLSS
jgi:hypothetical protein